MNKVLELLPHCIAFVASFVFVLLPLDRSRVRASWAKAILVTVGMVGVLVTATNSLMVLQWFVPSPEAAKIIHQTKTLAEGFAVGLIFALVLSRQLVGSKQGIQT
jgi:hypothetical protein